MAGDPTRAGPGAGGGASTSIKSMSWSCPKTPEQCCSDGSQPFSYFFCMSLCVLCCCEVKISFDDTDSAGSGVGSDPNNPSTPQKPGVRDYPTVTPSGNGVSFTASEYGKFIPIVFGSDKLTGNVIWYSGFTDHLYTSGGKVYQYKTVSFAIGLCEGEIDGALRIWIGDRLILDRTSTTDEDGVMQPNPDGFLGGADLDLISTDSPLASLADSERKTRITIYTGSERQLPENVMAAKEGYVNTPAYRGLAYVLFENFIIEDNSVPNIFVEVIANTSGILPRLYYDPAAAITKFTTLDASVLTYDPSYNMFLVRGYDGTGAGVPFNGNGYILVDGDSLEEIRQIEVTETLGIDEGEWDLGRHALTSGGHIACVVTRGNQGVAYIFNGVTGALDYSIGPGGSLAGHSLTTGFAAPADICVVQARGVSGLPADILCVTGFVNKSVGFAEIDSSNRLTMRYVGNGLLYGTNSAIVPMKVPTTFAASNPTFADGGATLGTHLFVVSWDSTNERTQFGVKRFTIEGGDATITVPDVGDDMVLDLNDLNGAGRVHKLVQVDVDPTDNCLVMQVQCVGGTSRLVKWSPFTEEVVWNYAAPVDTSGALRQSGVRQVILNQQYAFFGTDGVIYSVDLATGEMRASVDDLATQGLPSITTIRNYVYNAYDNSITYQSSTTGKVLTKVFLDRITRENVGVSNIVTTLLKRVGLGIEQMSVEDLAALSVTGYTVNSKKTLRTIFSELAQVFRFDIVESEGKIVYRSRGATSSRTIDEKYLAETSETDGWLKQTRDTDFTGVRKVNLTYRDIDREYDENVQAMALPKYELTQFDQESAIDVAVPIVLEADEAKRLAEILLYSKIIYATQYEGELAPQFIDLDPADVVTFDMGDDEITVRMRTVEIGADRNVKFTALQEDPDIYNDTVTLFGNVGRYEGDTISALDARVDPWVLSVPFISDSDAALTDTNYLLYVTLLNLRTTVAFDGIMTVVVDAGSQTKFANAPTTYPTWGYVTTPLEPRTSRYSTDTVSTLEIELVHTGPLGAPASAASLEDMIDNNQINLAYVGDELIQFQTVTSLGSGRYRLTNINRCLFGTDDKVAKHVSGERFILLTDETGTKDRTSIVRMQLAPGTTGPRKTVQVFLSSNNPWQPAPISMFVGLNLRPFPVSDFHYSWGATDCTIDWEYTPRYGGSNLDDGTESADLTEPSEAYDLYLFLDPDTFSPRDATTYMRKESLTSSSFVYTAAMQTADGFDRDTDDMYCMVVSTGSLSGNDIGLARVIAIWHKT